MRRFVWSVPTGLAVVLTATNAVKPAVVDDTAYLLFARHLAAHPLDPYGWELFWYAHPEPATDILLPPVVPYWLAAGIALFGEHLVLLKLWLLPIALLFCHAGMDLLRRFARGAERPGLVLLTLSPPVLALFNVMLDVPAVAVGLTAVAVFVRACDAGRVGPVLAAGVLAGVAAQTKYTMMTVPAVFGWYGLLTRRVRLAALAGAVGVGVFTGWEGLIAQRYGESHFLHHVADQPAATAPGERAGPWAVIAAWFEQKSRLGRPLLGHVGGLAVAWGLVAASALGASRRVVAGTAAVAAVAILAVVLTPQPESVFLRSRATGNPRLDLSAVVFYPLGAGVLAAATAGAGVLLTRWTNGPAGHVRRRPVGSWFLAGWLAVEVGGYFALTPFPAARRVLPICVVLGLLVCRLASRASRLRRNPFRARWLTGYGVALGFGLFALDAWDALPERQLAARAAQVMTERGANRMWYQGHWGWQYYCDRLGMRLVDPSTAGRPNGSRLAAGDYLAVPVLPDDAGFYRPYHGQATFRLDPTAVEPVAELGWDDPIAGQTIPNLHGGTVPVVGRGHPRLRVAVYRVTREWAPAP